MIVSIVNCHISQSSLIAQPAQVLLVVLTTFMIMNIIKLSCPLHPSTTPSGPMSDTHPDPKGHLVEEVSLVDMVHMWQAHLETANYSGYEIVQRQLLKLLLHFRL